LFFLESLWEFEKATCMHKSEYEVFVLALMMGKLITIGVVMKKFLLAFIYILLASSFAQATVVYRCVFVCYYNHCVNPNGTQKTYYELTVHDGKILKVFEKVQIQNYLSWQREQLNPPIERRIGTQEIYDIIKLNDQAYKTRKLIVESGDFSEIKISTLSADDEGTYTANYRLTCEIK
jgi:hypothetical protein